MRNALAAFSMLLLAGCTGMDDPNWGPGAPVWSTMGAVGAALLTQPTYQPVYQQQMPIRCWRQGYYVFCQ